MQHFKLRKVIKEYDTVKGNKKHLHKENKKLQAKIEAVKIGRVSNVHQKEKDMLQKDIGHWKS